MIAMSGTYAEFKWSVLVALDYSRTLRLSQRLATRAHEQSFELHFRGEHVCHSLVALWFDYELVTFFPVAAMQRVFTALGAAADAELICFCTETTTVVSAVKALACEEVARLPKTQAGRVAFLTECPADYATMFPFALGGMRIDPSRLSLVLDLLAAQCKSAKLNGKDDLANFAFQSVVAGVQMKGNFKVEAGIEPDGDVEREDNNGDAQLY